MKSERLKCNKMKQIYDLEMYSNLNEVKKEEKFNNQLISLKYFQPV